MADTFVKNTNENPCHMCMPMGGILALKGIEQTMVILHGSQGCSTYMRRHIAEHFNEPVDVASSSLNEKGTIYGGEKNLKQAISNVRRVYNPQLIGILTTCLAETIGEDVARLAKEYLEENAVSSELQLVTAATPGYGGNQSDGYFVTLRNLVMALTVKSKKHDRLNIFVPNISTADIREIKRIMALLGINCTICPDISDTLDRPYTPVYQKLPPGGTKLADIRAMSGAPATIQFGITVSEAHSPGRYLAEQFAVPLYNLPLPIGLRGMDALLSTIYEITGKSAAAALIAERGRLQDCMIDSHKYNFQGRSAIFGEPELVYAVTALCRENGIFPAVIAAGGKNTCLIAQLDSLLADCSTQPQILDEADFITIAEIARKSGVNIAIGHSDGRYLSEKAGIPLIRLGFPILDRVGGQRLLSVGYTGTAMLLDRITNTLLDTKMKSYRHDMYNRFYNQKAR